MTPKELKNSILQLAIQGKLVEQRSEEGTAEELFTQVQNKKRQLIKAGTIKKEKPLPEIVEDEKPFDIPESWKWVRVGSITTLNPKNNFDDNINAAFITMPCVADGFRNQHTFEVRKWKEIKKGFTHFANGDIGVAKITPCFQNRKSVIFKELENGFGAGTTELSIVRALGDTLAREYLLWFFKTDYFIVNGVKSFSGTAGQQRINKDYLATCLVPLPPLVEQKRIVEKIEELLPYIDRYECAWSKLKDISKRFPTDMQKSILQTAIQGKLVEQRPAEGTGEELYQQIQYEKQKLITGTIKKENLMPEVTEDDKPFDIPDNWSWIRLGNICSVVTGRLDANAQNVNGEYAFFTCGVEVFKTITYAFDCDAILLGGNNASGDYKMHRYAGKFNAYQRVYVITDPPKVILDYLFYVIKYWLPFLKSNSQGTTTRFIKLGQVTGMLIPFPPLTEQKRIVARMEEILPLCEKLK